MTGILLFAGLIIVLLFALVDRVKALEAPDPGWKHSRPIVDGGAVPLPSTPPEPHAKPVTLDGGTFAPVQSDLGCSVSTDSASSTTQQSKTPNGAASHSPLSNDVLPSTASSGSRT